MMMMMMMKTKQKKKMREQGTRGRRSVVGGIPIPGFSLSGAVEASRRCCSRSHARGSGQNAVLVRTRVESPKWADV